MSEPLSSWPDFDSLLLRDIVAALQRRGKAIRYRGRLSCECELEETAAFTFERLNVDIVTCTAL